MLRRRYTVMAVGLSKFSGPPHPFQKCWTLRGAEAAVRFVKYQSRRCGFPLDAWVEDSKATDSTVRSPETRA